MARSAEDWAETYRRMMDGELMRLAAEQDELVEEASAALRTVLAERGLADEPAASGPAETDQAEGGPAAPGPMSRLQQPRPATPSWGLMGASSAAQAAPGEDVAVYSAHSAEEAQEIQALLEEEGIETSLEVIVLVPRAQSEQAFEVLDESLAPPEDDDDEDDDEKEDEEKD